MAPDSAIASAPRAKGATKPVRASAYSRISISVSTIATASAAETHGGSISTMALRRSASKMLACTSTPAIGRDRPEVGVSTDSASPAAVTPTTRIFPRSSSAGTSPSSTAR